MSRDTDYRAEQLPQLDYNAYAEKQCEWRTNSTLLTSPYLNRPSVFRANVGSRTPGFTASWDKQPESDTFQHATATCDKALGTT